MATAERKVVLITRHRAQTLGGVGRQVPLGGPGPLLPAKHLGADFSDYLAEHETYAAAKRTVTTALEAHGRYQAIDRGFLTNFMFAPDDVVVALGQDGLVANTMKYLDGQPIIGVNPDRYRWDGILLPFEPRDVGTRAGSHARPSCPQGGDNGRGELIGRSAIACRERSLYRPEKPHLRTLRDRTGRAEGGAIVERTDRIPLGLGSTAWMKSVVMGSLAIASEFAHPARTQSYAPAPWDASFLQFAVREPFPSRSSHATLVFGRVDSEHQLKLRSFMPESGVIFSDGIESDYVSFNSGVEATIGVAKQSGKVIV